MVFGGDDSISPFLIERRRLASIGHFIVVVSRILSSSSSSYFVHFLILDGPIT